MKKAEKEMNVAVAVLAIVGLLWFLSLAPAGDLEPASPPGSTMHTLEEIYNLHAPSPSFETSVGRGTSNIFMRIAGVNGESQDQDHKDWIDVASFQQAHAAPPLETSGSTRLGPVVFENLVVVKPLDKASPRLAEAVCKGTVFPEVEIHVTGTYDGSTRPAGYLRYRLTNVLVVSYNIRASGQSDSPPMEEVTFNFAEITVTYTQTNSSGVPLGDVEYHWRVDTGV